MGSQMDFRLFGDCSIEVPTGEELQKISKYLPLLKAFEETLKTRVEEMWDFGAAFEYLVEQDTAAWKRLGAERPPYFVQPSGSTKSPLAIHLLNPTFYVADSKNMDPFHNEEESDEEEGDDYVEAEMLDFANIPTTLRLWLRS
ncbi:hypothetical protein PENDEC_c003G00221 [Penicillium decumbens]|uniref:Uncharacterized protein n=1 Tax=Penicillium decumbens TaxID=69771 RepID=A0A1V6PIB5_PENDC|nr:hypothetical protein PENDEC_c003G00221 [Penicillium decumbens]